MCSFYGADDGDGGGGGTGRDNWFGGLMVWHGRMTLCRSAYVDPWLVVCNNAGLRGMESFRRRYEGAVVHRHCQFG